MEADRERTAMTGDGHDSTTGCRRARDHRPQDVLVLALWCTSNPANRTELAFHAELSTNGSERLELRRGRVCRMARMP
jgi:hypothetical protein